MAIVGMIPMFLIHLVFLIYSVVTSLQGGLGRMRTLMGRALRLVCKPGEVTICL